MRPAITLIVTLACIPATVAAQSLADLARRTEKERAEAKNPPSKVITDKDLKGAPAPPDVAGLREGTFKANILVTDSHAAIERWVLMLPADRSRAGRLREVTPGTKIYLPAVVTDYVSKTPDKMNLTAAIHVVAPNGQTLDATAMALDSDPRTPGLRVLQPVLNITFDSDSTLGTYTIRGTFTDLLHATYAKAEETFQLVQAATKR